MPDSETLQKSESELQTNPIHDTAVALTDIKQDDSPSQIYIADDKDSPVIATLLEIGVEQEIDPARIQLIAEKLTEELNFLKTVDWYKRENIQSQMRTSMRVILRKLSYPTSHRDEVIVAIMDYLINEEAEVE